MGNQNDKNITTETQIQSSINPESISISQSKSPSSVWLKSQKTIADLQSLIKSDPNWHQTIRPYLRKITSKQQYQRYLRAILQEILQSYDQSQQSQFIQKDHDNLRTEENIKTQTEKLINEQQPRSQESREIEQTKKKQQLFQLFHFYKLKLQQSYFVIHNQKAGVRQSIGQTQFQQSLKSIWAQGQFKDYEAKTFYSANNEQFQNFIPSLMLSNLYQYSSINQNYMDEVFIELNIKAYNNLQQFTKLLIEDFITIDDQFNLQKFIVNYQVFLESLTYYETCAKILPHDSQHQAFQIIRKFKTYPTSHYIQMCRVFLQYKNVIGAQIIIRNLIQKGYHLTEEEINFYLYVELYNIFVYHVNLNSEKLSTSQLVSILDKKQGSFIAFNQVFENISIEQIFDLFLIYRPYSEIDLIKKCFETAFNIQSPQIGEVQFLKHLKSYALGQKSHFIILIEALKSHLTELQDEQKKDIETLFLQKLSSQLSQDIIEYENHVIDLVRMYKFSKEGYNFIKILFKVSSILTKFQITSKISEICQFLFHNKNLISLNKLKEVVLGKNFLQKNVQELQFLALVIIKKVITKYFVLGQSKEEVVFIIEDKFDEECFEYSTKEIESLFILTEYLHQNLFETFVPLQQLHQLLFQHIFAFGKYDQVQVMIKAENLSRYFIQIEVVKLLIIENIRQTLITSQKNISVLSQQIKKQFKIIDKIHENQVDAGKLQSEIDQNIKRPIIDYHTQQTQQLQSIKALFKLLVKLDFYSISLNQEQKQNIGINLLYFLIEHFQHQIEVFDYDALYRLIVLAQSKNHQLVKEILQNNDHHVPVTNEYLKFKIDLAHLSFQKGKIKFGQNILKQVLEYEPPWISSQIIKIIRGMPHSSSINQYFLNLAFQYCVKGEDLIYLLKVWKQKMQQRHKKTGQKISQIFESTKKFMVIDDTYIKDQKQYRNLIAQMSFNDEILKSQNYDMIFTLLGTEPERAFHLIYSKNLQIVKIQIILKQGMKLGIFNILNTCKIFFKLLFFVFQKDTQKMKHHKHLSHKISFIKFKNTSIQEVINKVQERHLFLPQDKNIGIQKEISFIILKKMYKALKSLLILPSQFIQNYIENSSSINQQIDRSQLVYMFAFDQNYRQKHLIALKDEPMGRSDIKIYKQLCQVNGMNILDLTLFNLTNHLNTVQPSLSSQALEDQKIQNMLQKIVTWTENDPNLIHSILSKFIQKIFSFEMLFSILKFIRERQNPLIREIVTQQHMQILQSLKRIQLNTELHGLITEQFFQKPIAFNPKHKLSQKHVKILKKQLKLRNVFLISKILYFCYGMSSDVEKQVLKLFVKQNQNKEEIQIFDTLKKKIHEAQS